MCSDRQLQRTSSHCIDQKLKSALTVGDNLVAAPNPSARSLHLVKTLLSTQNKNSKIRSCLNDSRSRKLVLSEEHTETGTHIRALLDAESIGQLRKILDF